MVAAFLNVKLFVLPTEAPYFQPSNKFVLLGYQKGKSFLLPFHGCSLLIVCIQVFFARKFSIGEQRLSKQQKK